MPPVAVELKSALPRADLPLRVQAVTIPSVDDRSRAQIIVEVPAAALAMDGPPGDAAQTINFALYTEDAAGRRSNGTSATVNLALPPDQIARVRAAGVRWLTSIDLSPGTYHLRVAAKTTPASRAGSVFSTISVPRPDDQPSTHAIAVTSNVAVLAATVGGTSLFPQLPAPPTTVRTFIAGDIVYLTAPVVARAGSKQGSDVRVQVTEASAPETPRIDRVVPIMRSPLGYDFVRVDIDTTQLGPGRFAARFQPEGRSRDTGTATMYFEIVEKQ